MSNAYSLTQTEFYDAVLPAATDSAPPGVVRQYTWHGPAAVGSVAFTEYHLPGGYLTYMDGQLRRPLELQIPDHQPCLGLVFQLAGHSESVLEKRRRFRVETHRDNLLFEPSPDVRHRFEPTPDGRHQCVHLRFNVDYFRSLIADNPDWQPLYADLLPGQDPFTLFRSAQATTPQVRELLAQLRHCPYSGTLQKLYLEARFLDLFVAQHQHYRTLQAPPERRRGQELLLAVRAYLDQHYAQPPSLSALAREFGTNDFALKKGFHEEFGTIVFGYVAQKRLTEAYALLTHTDQHVQDVAESVGFSSPAHFATAFKRHFGLPPQQARRRPSSANL